MARGGGAQHEGASRLVLNGQAAGNHLYSVLAEQALADEALPGRLAASLVALGYGELTDRAKRSQLAKLDGEIKTVEAELMKARKAAALAEVEAQFTGEPA